MSTPEAQLVWCLRQRREYHSTDNVRWYQVTEPDGDCQRAADTIERLHSEKLELLRWKGIHAPRLVAVEGLLREAQQEAAAGREAIANLASLDSERQANAMLTAEVERLTAERDALRAALAEADRLASHDDSMTEWRERCAHLWAGAAPAPAPQPFDWPKLTKPAKVGGGTFNVGVSARLVVEAAQRQHEYAEAEGRKTPEEWQQVERARRELWDMLNGPPAPAIPAAWSVFNSGAHVASGLTYAEALDYLTPERLSRGWSAVCIVDKDTHGIGTDAQAQGGKP